MAKIGIRNVMGLGDVPQLNHWRFEVTVAPRAVATPSSEEFDVRCISSDIPRGTISPKDISIRGHRVSQPGDQETAGDIKLTFYENNKMKLNKFIFEWTNKCSNLQTQRKELVEDIKATISLYLLNRQDEDIAKYTLFGAFITDSDGIGGSFSGEKNAALVQPTFTLRYDTFEVTFLS